MKEQRHEENKNLEPWSLNGSKNKTTKTNTTMEYTELSPKEEYIGKAIVNAAYRIHTELGPGLLEKIYEVCMSHELRRAGFNVKRQVDIPLFMMAFNSMKV